MLVLFQYVDHRTVAYTLSYQTAEQQLTPNFVVNFVHSLIRALANCGLVSLASAGYPFPVLCTLCPIPCLRYPLPDSVCNCDGGGGGKLMQCKFVANAADIVC